MLMIFKRYLIAFIFLFLVVLLMIIATIGVKQFGERMIENTDIEMKPRGERIN